MNTFAIIFLATFGLFAVVKKGTVQSLLGVGNGLAGLGLAIWVLAS